MRVHIAILAAALVVASGAELGLSTPAVAQQPASTVQLQARTPARNIVLVHGAWADGSSWSRVIPLLQAAGYNVTSVQNALSSLAAAEADVQRVIDAQDGPTVLVGHSWSGTIVSDLGADPKVSAIVYVAARAPAAGEDFLALQATFPDTPARAGIMNRAGYTTLSESAFLNHFANGVPRDEARVLYAVQSATAASLFSERTTRTAWRLKPSYYAVARNDQTIAPDFERYLAARMNAHTIEVDAGHLAMVSEPRAIADLILRAARGE